MERVGVRPRIMGVLADLSLGLFSIFLGLLGAEVAVRSFSPIGPALLVTDAAIGKHFVPGFVGEVHVDEAGRLVPLRFNSAGFRGAEWSKTMPANGLRVAVIGDSMTAAVATDEEKTFVRRLEADLAEAHPDRRIEVMNVGVSSASTATELVTWRRVVAPHAPDVVLLAFFTGNDLGDNCRRLTRAPRFYFDLDEEGILVPGAEPRPTPALTRWLDLNSRLYVWQKVAFRQLRASGRSASSGIEPGQRIFVVGEDPDTDHAWRLTEVLIRQVRDEVEAAGARFGLVVIPCAEQVDDGLWADLEKRGAEAGHRLDRAVPSRRFATIAERSRLRLLDLAPVFAAAARRSDPSRASAQQLYLMGRFHLSDEGNRVVAESLVRFLAAEDLIPRP